MPIDKFRGRYWFLSNFYPAEFEYRSRMGKSRVFKTAEHAYQLEKAISRFDRERIQNAATPGAAKRIGRRIGIWSDWEKVKLEVMLKIVEAKFRNKQLAELLLATGDRELVEGNYWGDTFWGVCRGEGENHLGKILMKVREGLKDAD